MLKKSGIVFIGPPGSAMRSLGDKISSTIVAQSARVPTIEWSGSNISETEEDSEGYLLVPEKAYKSACVEDLPQGLRIAQEIGYPIMIKASEGGGGKGIRKVESNEEFTNSFLQVQSEVPGSPIFIMKLAGKSRHLEVQILADQYGNAISLFGRDCSVQRRHQKIIEEAPVTIAPENTLKEMERSAVRLAKLVGYISAGTVEYLYDYERDKFYFLELNPRLQVEHPTTEMVSNVNLPAAQLQIAMGIPLHNIEDIRLLYGEDQNKKSPILFEDSYNNQRNPKPKGHVIAVRITAENPDAGFKPSGGTMQELNFRSNTNVWGYFSVGTLGGLHEFADSQFGHIFAKGETREVARNNMIIALKNLSIRGDFRTTDSYIIKLLETPEFINNKINTSWLDSLIASNVSFEKPDFIMNVLCGAVYKAHFLYQDSRKQYMMALKKGQVINKNSLRTSFDVDFIYDNFHYNFVVTICGPMLYNVYINGSKAQIGIRDLADGGYLLLVDGKSHTLYAKEEIGATRLIVDGKTFTIEQENDPSQLRSPSSGKLIKFMVESGDHVKAGNVYAEIEVMKMYMSLNAPADGIVHFIKQPGSSLEQGEVLGILTLDDPSCIKRPTTFTQKLPLIGSPLIQGEKIHQKYTEVVQVIQYILKGYDDQTIVQSNIKNLFDILKNRQLPYMQYYDCMSSLSNRIPQDLENNLNDLIDKFSIEKLEFPANELLKTINEYLDGPIPLLDIEKINNNLTEIFKLIKDFSGGLDVYNKIVVSGFLESYYSIETLFNTESQREDEVILSLRDQFKDDLEKIVDIVFSHSKISSKNNLILALMNEIQSSNINVKSDKIYCPVFQKLSSLNSKHTTKISLKAREMLIQGELPSYQKRHHQMKNMLISSITENYYEGGQGYREPNYADIKELVLTNFCVEDVLNSFFYSENINLRLASFEVYIRRSYHSYEITEFFHKIDDHLPFFEWNFRIKDYPNRTSFSDSVSDVSSLFRPSSPQSSESRKGIMISFLNLFEAQNNFSDILINFENNLSIPKNVLIISIKNMEESDDKRSESFEPLLQSHKDELKARNIKRVSFIVYRHENLPAIYTFRERSEYKEDKTIRHIEPSVAYFLELTKLDNFKLTPYHNDKAQVHIYHATSKIDESDQRFFIRSLMRPGKIAGNVNIVDYLISEGDRLLNIILDSLDILKHKHPKCDCNVIFVNIIPAFKLDQAQIFSALEQFLNRYGTKLFRLRVVEAEIRLVVLDNNEIPTPLRFFISNVSGFDIRTELYTEYKDINGTIKLKSLMKDCTSRNLQPTLQPYTPKEWLQPKRYQAHKLGTTYVYDFLELFNIGLKSLFKELSMHHENTVDISNTIFEYKELILDENNELQEVSRPPGLNSCGMVAWLLKFSCFEYPEGREIILIANDITFQIGSFGPMEDLLFYLATKKAREMKIPRIYISANSGARIGLAEEIKKVFKIKFKDDEAPECGIEYLYLEKRDFEKYNEYVNCQELVENGEYRYRIMDIIGKTDGLGVECLKGSALIAGETSRAYNDIFTINLVTSRSVGIGAYLVRLGQRTVQNKCHPIILTGADALNKVLGREVYTSNLQLGGTQIMLKNGVSHLMSENDLDGIKLILKWLSFVPKNTYSLPPIISSYDTIYRSIDAEMKKGPSDPRNWISGYFDSNGIWQSGFLDKDSFFETLKEWAPTVITGHGRLGGIPMGVIAVETRTLERVVPADPANDNSEEKTIIEPGQVWYPNSSYKTAQFINDCNFEGIPLIIFANWRGFSGGQNDMFNEILKFGSMIVDALSNYKNPVFVYLPPHSELRGGAWVVLDSSINKSHMEFYADPNSKGGILEPEAIVGIKYKIPHLYATMDRLDEKLKDLISTLNNTTNIELKGKIQTDINERRDFLYPIYTQISVQFADLHDNPGRMLAKECINKIIPFSESRKFFYFRALRKIKLENIIKNSNLDREELLKQLEFLFTSSVSNDSWDDDEKVIDWLSNEANQKTIFDCIDKMKKKKVIDEVFEVFEGNKMDLIEGFSGYLSSLSTEEKEALIQKLN